MDRPLRWYTAESPGTRVHLALRWATCPVGPVAALLPACGRILDWGCGHGLLSLWAAHRGGARMIHGADIDRDKVAVARRAAGCAGLDGRVSFSVLNPREDPEGQWDAVVINDVLYLLDPTRQQKMVEAAAAALAPGGILVVKEMAPRPRWKAQLNRGQERIVVGRLGITASENGPQHPPVIDDLVRWMGRSGLVVEQRRMDRHYHCPHLAVVGRRSPAGAEDDLRLPDRAWSAGRLPL